MSTYEAVTTDGVTVTVRSSAPFIDLKLSTADRDAEWIISFEEARLLREGLDKVLPKWTKADPNDEATWPPDDGLALCAVRRTDRWSEPWIIRVGIITRGREPASFWIQLHTEFSVLHRPFVTLCTGWDFHWMPWASVGDPGEQRPETAWEEARR